MSSIGDNVVKSYRKARKVRHHWSFYFLVYFFPLAALIVWPILFGEKSQDQEAVSVYNPDYKLLQEEDGVELKWDTATLKRLSPYGKISSLIYLHLENRESSDSEFPSISMKPTKGSLNTLIEIEASGKDTISRGIGLVQGDVLYHYFHGKNTFFPTQKKRSAVRALANVYYEWLHVFVSPLDSLLKESLVKDDVIFKKDFQPFTGAIGSGHRVTADNLRNVFSITDGFGYDSEFTPMDPRKTDLRTNSNNRYYAMVYAPNKEKWEYSNIGLSKSTAEIIVNAFHECYQLARIDTFYNYKDLGERYTVEINAILIGDKQLPKGVVKEIETLFDSLDSKTYSLDSCFLTQGDSRQNLAFKTLWKDIKTDSIFIRTGSKQENGRKESRWEGFTIARHNSLIKEKIGWLAKYTSVVLNQTVIAFIAFYFFWVILAGAIAPTVIKVTRFPNLTLWQRIRMFYKESQTPLTVLFLIFGLHLLIAFLIWSSEYHFSDELEFIHEDSFVSKGPLNTLGWLVRDVTGNRNEYTLQSDLALVWLNLLKAGYAISSTLITVSFASQIFRMVKLNPLKDHMVIIGWRKNSGTKIIEELYDIAKSSGKGEPEIRIVNYREFKETGLDTKFERAYISLENMREAYQEASLAKAKTIIVLSDPKWAEHSNIADVDFWTIKKLVEITSYLRDHQGKSKKKIEPRIIAEIENDANVKAAKLNGASEVICSKHFARKIIAHTAQKPGLSSIFDELLVTDTAHNEIYYLDIPSGFFNTTKKEVIHAKNFGSLMKYLRGKGLPKKGIVIGIHNPTEDSPAAISLTDREHPSEYPDGEPVISEEKGPSNTITFATKKIRELNKINPPFTFVVNPSDKLIVIAPSGN